MKILKRFFKPRLVVPASVAAVGLALAFGVTLAVAVAPTVTIENASGVSYTSAHAKGTVDPEGSDTNCHFEYVSQGQLDENIANGLGEWEGAGQAACNVEPVSGSGPQSVEANLEGLTPSTVYHLRLVAANADGQSEAKAAATFETKAVAAATATMDPVVTFTGTTAHFSGTVKPNAPAGNPAAFDLNWHFECSPACPGAPGGAIAADNANHAVAADATGLEPNTSYGVKLVAENAGGPASSATRSFTTAAVGPEAETMPAFALGNGTEAEVGGRINPRNSATTYWVEYGTSTAYGQSAPLAQDGSAGAGGQPVVVTQRIGGLTPGTVYHFRVVAKNSTGTDPGNDENFQATPPQPAETFCANERLRAENNSTALPECRAYEQVSPVVKNGYDAGANPAVRQSNYVAAEQGSALAFESFGAFADAKAATILNTYISRRGADGWSTHGLSAAEKPRNNVTFTVFQAYSPDLGKAIVQLRPPTSLAPGDTPEATNLYLRDTTTDTYRTLNLGGGIGGSSFQAASRDMKHILIDSDTALPSTPASPPGAFHYLYQWNEGEAQLRLVTVDQAGVPFSEGGFVGNLIEPTTGAISEDGSRSVFKAFNDLGLYLRLDGQKTVEISASHRAVPDSAPHYTSFLGAAADTRKIFFSDRVGLTEDAPTGGNPNLYLYEVGAKPEEGKLTYLTPNAVSGVPQVEGMAAISKDGSYAYFRAQGAQITAGQVESGSSLYLWHDGTVTHIANDPGDGNFKTQALYTTYRISEDGTKLIFSTANRLTSYDNTDAASGEPDPEVYVYDATADRLTCVSCNPSGALPRGGGEFPPPPPRPQRNYQPGFSADGSRAYFNSADALVPRDVNGKMDVYEWVGGHPRLISSGTDGNDSFYASASASGTDVFFSTRAQLAPRDEDRNHDIYDARVGGGFPGPPPSSVCEGIEGCHGPASAVPPFKNPASGSFSSDARQPSPAVLRLRRALKACKHREGKQAKAKCRARAKKRFAKSKGRTH